MALALAQAPDFSGTWRLDTGRSRIAPTAGLAGLAGAGAPDTLHVTQPANGTLVIESQINESHARLYTSRTKIVTPVTVGPGGRVAMTSRWDGRTLVSEGTRESSSGTSTIVQEVKEVIGVSADGRTLTIEITTQGPEATSTSTLMYTRIVDVGPCKTWQTPCKTPSSP
ncbi:MAG: hypothetical protein ACRD1S_03380 [Vicinamibacterales bacterium]